LSSGIQLDGERWERLEIAIGKHNGDQGSTAAFFTENV
jgi:hypothetical protein